MSVLYDLDEFVCQLLGIRSAEDLKLVLGHITCLLGFEHFALAEHVGLHAQPNAIRLYSHPELLTGPLGHRRRGASDPLRRACDVSGIGFDWRELPNLIDLTPSDRRILAAAAAYGIDSGFTVPISVPGEIYGSCSFVGHGRTLPRGARPIAQLAGTFAFEAARRLWHRPAIAPLHARLTDRERDCVIWVGRDKTDWEVAQILGISEGAVVQHIKNARRRYRVGKRTSLIVLALFDGTISFRDLLIY